MKVVAQSRQLQGSSASRRLRLTGNTPGIVYGGPKPAAAITLEHNALYHALRVESFHSSVLDLSIDGQSEQVVLRNVQWHPYKPLVLHIDFQRVDANAVLTIKVPLHFLNQEASPAVKLQAAVVNHVMNELEVQCLPSNLPEFIEVDLSNLSAEHAIHLSMVKLPVGVTAVPHGGDTDPVLVNATVMAGSTAAGEEEK